MVICCPRCGASRTVEQTCFGIQVRCEVCGLNFIAKSNDFVECPTCNRLISSKETFCKTCGTKLPRKTLNNSVYDNDKTALGEKERKHLESHPSDWFYFPYFILTFLFILPGAFPHWLSSLSEIDTNYFNILGMLLGILTFLACIIQRNTTTYTVTNFRIIIQTGCVRVRRKEVLIRDIIGISQNTNIFSHYMGIGDIAVGTAGTTKREMTMHGLENPEKWIETINTIRLPSDNK